MSSSKSFSIRKDLPTLITAKAKGYFDYKEVKVFNDEISYNINMTEYDRLNYVINSSDLNPKSITFNALTLPDYSYADGETKVLMPYDNGKVYHNVNILVKNAYFENVGCNIDENNIASGFSTTNGLHITRAFPETFSSAKFIFKCAATDTSHNNAIMAITSSSTSKNFLIDTSGIFCYYPGSWVRGTTTLSTNQSYWFGINYDGTNFIGYYLLDDGSYTIDTLPDFNSWTQEWTSTANIFAGQKYAIGYNYNTPASFFSGSIDLSNSRIWIDGEPWWYYNMENEISYNLNGCLYNYTDTGAAATLNCFYYNNTYVISDDENIAGGLYLGQVSVPAHDLYTYSETPYQVYDNFTVVGTSLIIDQESGKVSGFSSSSYLDTGYRPDLSDGKPWKMRVRFKYDKVNSFQVFLSGTTYANAPYIAVGTNYLVDCGISNGGSRITWIEGTTVLEDGVNYIVEFSYDGNTTYTVRLKQEDGSWNTENTYTYDGKADFGSNLYIGRNGSGYARGVIDLSTDTYFEIDGVKTWIPTTTHYNTTWTKQS